MSSPKAGRDQPVPRISITNRYIPVPEETIRDFCKKWHIRSFQFFGSIVRDDFRPDSDIDVMVVYEDGFGNSFTDICTMQEELEANFGRKVDLADRRTVEQGENYIRRNGMLTGKPPLLRQMSYLLDMLISARRIEEITGNKSPDILDTDEMMFHALSFNSRFLVTSAYRIDVATREKYPDIPWNVLLGLYDTFESDPFDPDKQRIQEMAWEVVPHIIPILTAIIPKEAEV